MTHIIQGIKINTLAMWEVRGKRKWEQGRNTEGHRGTQRDREEQGGARWSRVEQGETERNREEQGITG